MVKDVASRAYLRYAPDQHLVFASFAAAFLLKLLRHKFVHLVSESHRTGIIPLVETLIRTLDDQSVAIDETHTPKIYARFLAGLLQKHRILASAPRHEEHENENDADMMNHQEQPMGLSIDFSMLHQANSFPAGPLSPPSPHPSIQVTPPPVGDHSFGYIVHDPNMDEYGLEGQDDMGMFGNSGAPPSGSGTVHPMDERAREEEDDDILPSLRAINPSFWLHGMVPWPVVNMPAGQEDRGLAVGPYSFMDS